MVISVVWDNHDHTMLRWEFPPVWDWADFDKATAVAGSLAATVPYAVGCIFVVENSQIPADAYQQLDHRIKALPANASTLVAVGRSASDSTILTLLITLYGTWNARMKFARTLEDARDIIGLTLVNG